MPERRVTTGSPKPPRTFADEVLARAEVVSAAPGCEGCAAGGSLERELELGLGLGLEFGRGPELGFGAEVRLGLGLGFGLEVRLGLGLKLGPELGPELGLELGLELGFGLGLEVRLELELGFELELGEPACDIGSRTAARVPSPPDSAAR